MKVVDICAMWSIRVTVIRRVKWKLLIVLLDHREEFLYSYVYVSRQKKLNEIRNSIRNLSSRHMFSHLFIHRACGF